MEAKPFDLLGRKVGLDEAEVLFRLIHLKEKGIIQRIQSVLDIRSLGYQSALVAMRFPEDRLEKGAEVINHHPGVSRSDAYRHTFNFWFTLSLPGQARFEDHLKRLQKRSGAEEVLLVPALKVYSSGRVYETGKDVSQSKEIVSEDQIDMIRVLQEEFPLTDRPFRKMAQAIGTDEADFLKKMAVLKEKGILKRFMAFEPMPPLGEISMIQVAWQIPEEAEEKVGRYLARQPHVLSCCRRPAHQNFPFSLYMVFQRMLISDCEQKVEELKQEVGAWPHVCLERVKTYKKTPLKYFTKELDQWWGGTDGTAPSEKVAVG